ncbi:HTH domain-containing protein [Clostridium perfringens]|uniref:FeoC-like transcriptional regulator n=1 Tax=Clostridium perfringens TaxID=1502 RepID=UPI001ABB6016|nr:FeoC-like transcriptional regulator [Clostridium perfringens]MBO3388082.1 HTH domain-containing protein [Clostridium perfringens]MBO3413539.1 HTH domain-containing protein [Clostridium perfringens]
MLKAILKIMKNSNEFSSSTIAKELNISETMVEIYKEQLEQKGYIKKISLSGCPQDQCSSCGCGCGISKSLNSISGWEITEKGLLVLQK